MTAAPTPPSNPPQPERVAESKAWKIFNDLVGEDLLAFTLLMTPGYKPSLFHAHIARDLTKIVKNEKTVEVPSEEDGKPPTKEIRRRFIFTTPPRHGKSTLVSENLPAFLLARNPNCKIIVAGYGQQLSVKASKACRRRVNSPIFQKRFPKTKISPDEAAAHMWTTTEGGSFQAVGLGSAITGYGADVLIIDDVHKSRQEAESPRQRENVWDWWIADASTRLAPDGIVIVIMTRWHKDDFAGRLMDPEYQADLREAGAEEEVFEKVNYEALSSGHGDPLNRPKEAALWPERWTHKIMNARRARSGSYDWNALYQGDPIDREGNFELVSRFKYCDMKDVPVGLRKARGWDLAVTKGQENDFTAGALGAYDKSREILYIMDIDHFKSRWLGVKERILGHLSREQNTAILEAAGQAQGLYDEFAKERKNRNIKGITKMQIPVTDKFTRAIGWITLLERGNVYLVRGPWNLNFIREFTEFSPSCLHDDQVDAVSIMYAELQRAGGLFFA